MSRVGIFGGTFNPPHSAHVRLVAFIRAHYAFDRMLVIPCALPPHKQLADHVSAADRLAMARLAFDGLAEVLDIEIRRGGKSYTVDTLRALEAPGRELTLFMGGDMLLTLHQWKNYEEILQRAKLRVFPRKREETEIDRRIEELRRQTGGDIERVPLESFPLSSTQLRSAFSEGTIDRTLIPKSVENYIKEHKLYQK